MAEKYCQARANVFTCGPKLVLRFLRIGRRYHSGNLLLALMNKKACVRACGRTRSVPMKFLFDFCWLGKGSA